MPKVVVIGIGKSSPYLIKCLQNYSLNFPLHITLVDTTWQALPQDCKNHDNTTYITSNINDQDKLGALVNTHDLVISMLPAQLHITIAKLCLQHKKDLLTASYVGTEMKQLHQEAQNKGILFLNEMGVDPGLDHMSALQLIHNLKNKKAQITKFYSHTGGLVSKTVPNTWNYKFTWNPKNVITAGAEGATYINHKQKTNVAYNSIFKRYSLYIYNLKNTIVTPIEIA